MGDAVTICFLVEAGPKLRTPFLLPVVEAALGVLLEGVVGLLDVLNVKDLVLDIGALFFSPSTVRSVGVMFRKTTFGFLRIPHFTRSSIVS